MLMDMTLTYSAVLEAQAVVRDTPELDSARAEGRHSPEDSPSGCAQEAK